MPSTNDIPAGDYHIVNVANTKLALDVKGASTEDRAKVQVATRNYSDAQVWSISYRDDGTAQVLYRFVGKSLELYRLNLAQGANVSVYTDNDSDAQKWNLVPTGEKATVDGVSYDTYQIELVYNDQGWVAECYGSGVPVTATNVCIAANAHQADQKWVFIPLPKVQDGGLYEIHSVMDSKMVFDVQGLSTANGANLQLSTPNGGNNQKFVLEKATNGSTLVRSVYSGKYMQVYGAEAVQGANVCQYGDKTYAETNTHNQWVVTEYGVAKIGGVDRAVVSFGSKLNTNYLMNTRNALTTAGTNIQLEANSQGPNQEFTLVPTFATDPTMPVPYNLGDATEVGGSVSLANPTQDKLYPSWLCAAAWSTISGNSYQYRDRTRYLKATSNTWTEWSDWSEWGSAAVTVDGNKATLTQGYDASYDIAVYKNLEHEFQVRAVGVDNLSNLIGGTADCVTRAPIKPTITLSNAGWSGDGLHVDYESDYLYGTNSITVESVTTTRDGTTETTQPRTKLDAPDSSGNFTIPADKVYWPGDSTKATIVYSVGTDQQAAFNGTESVELSVAYNTGHSASVVPIITQGVNRTIDVSVPHVGVDRLYMYIDGETVEVTGGVTSGSRTTFNVAFPFNKSFDLLVSCMSEDGDTWGTAYKKLTLDTPPLNSITPAHCFNWQGGTFTLEIDDDVLTVIRSQEPSYEAYELLSREHNVVSFSDTVKSSFKAQGVLVEGVTESSTRTADALLKARHVTYRAPSGEIVDVAITGVDYDRQHDHDTCTVSMIEETL